MIKLDEKVFQRISEHAESTYPYECCGFLFGFDGEIRTISDAKQVSNTRQGDQRKRYSISPKDYMAAEQFADENDLILLGIYHSHPDHHAKASETDRVSAQPFFSYLILSVVDGAFSGMQSWRLNDDAIFYEEEISIEQIKDLTWQQ